VLLVAPGLDADGLTRQARAAGIDDVAAISADSSAAGDMLNRGLDAASGDLIAVVDPGSSYDEHFLGDLVHAFSYTDAAVVGKRAHYASDGAGEPELRFGASEHVYTDELEQGTLLISGELLRRLRFEDASDEPETDLLRRCASEGARLFAADRFSFVAGRRDRSRAGV
jgi:hypothetical protein